MQAWTNSHQDTEHTEHLDLGSAIDQVQDHREILKPARRHD